MKKIEDCWISLFDRIPEHRQEVLVSIPSESQAQVMCYDGVTYEPNGKGGKIRCHQFYGENDEGKRTWETTEVTHWMPLPAKTHIEDVLIDLIYQNLGTSFLQLV